MKIAFQVHSVNLSLFFCPHFFVNLDCGMVKTLNEAKVLEASLLYHFKQNSHWFLPTISISCFLIVRNFDLDGQTYIPLVLSRLANIDQIKHLLERRNQACIILWAILKIFGFSMIRLHFLEWVVEDIWSRTIAQILVELLRQLAILTTMDNYHLVIWCEPCLYKSIFIRILV